MYVTIEEAAEFLSLSERDVQRLILEGKIRTVHDGTQFLINKAQFDNYFEQLEKVKQLIEEWKNEPIPDDIDVKDED